MKLRPQVSARLQSSRCVSQVSVVLAAAVMAAVAASVAAQRQFEELGKRGLPAEREFTRATVLGDVDGDGDLDLVVGNDWHQCRLQLNNGSGTFTDATATRMPVGSYKVHSLALGDVDGDSDLDLVVGIGGSFPGQSRLYVNNGTGTFTDATASRMPVGTYYTTSLALGDVDGDGDLDLVIGCGDNRGAGQSRLHLNDGTGTFTDVTASRMPVGSYQTHSLALGDVDGDGDLDLVVGDVWQPNRLYLNDGTGTFTDATAARMPVGRRLTLALALGDVDGDGDLDLIVGNEYRQILLYLNNGSGTFTDSTATRMPGGDYRASSLALGDVDGDGDLDLVVGIFLQQSLLFLNNGTGTFTDATASRLPFGDYLTCSLALGDVDWDGDLDLVVGKLGQQNLLYLNNGTGTFTDATASRLPVKGHGTTSLALGDVDGDGDRDLVVGNAYSPYAGGGQSLLYLNDGTGTFTDATAARMPAGMYHTTSLTLGDVDRDGDLDLVVGNSFGRYGGGGQSLLYLNDGTGTFTDVTTARMPVGIYHTTSLALGDVDGDSDLDLVVGNGGRFQEQSLLYLNNGTGTFTDATSARMPVGIYDTASLALGDVDGDGDLDLLVGNLLYSNSLLYLNNGTGTFVDGTATRMPIVAYYTCSLALGDVEGDGDLDLVVGNEMHASRLYLNNGSGTFIDATASRMPVGIYPTTSLALGDVDRDGDLDLVLGNRGQSLLYQNLLRQIDAPYVLPIGRNYQIDVYSRNGPASQVDIASPCLATATASIPVPPLGILGLDPNHFIPLPHFVVPQPAGVASLFLAVPNAPSLVGVPIHTQALLIQLPGQSLLTNVNTDIILR